MKALPSSRTFFQFGFFDKYLSLPHVSFLLTYIGYILAFAFLVILVVTNNAADNPPTALLLTLLALIVCCAGIAFLGGKLAQEHTHIINAVLLLFSLPALLFIGLVIVTLAKLRALAAIRERNSN